MDNTDARNSNHVRRATEIHNALRSTVTVSDRSMISQSLLDAEVELKEYQAQINRLQASIWALESKSKRLMKNMESYRSLLSPVRRMPLEILTMIFTFLCGNNDLVPSTPPPAISLSMVCGRWRDIALSSPTLWSTLSLDFSHWTEAARLHSLENTTRLFMENSGRSPLKISVTFPSHEFPAEALPSLRNISKQCNRWQSLSLTFSEPSGLPFAGFDAIRGELPMLQCLSLIRQPYTDITTIWEDCPLLNLFDTCPSLRTLDISPDDYLLDDEEPPLPCRQIKALQIRNSHNRSALSLLSTCPNVEDVELTGLYGSNESWPDFEGYVVSDVVKSLTVMGATRQPDLDDILRHLTLPGLTSLVLSGHGIQWIWDGSILKEFFHRSTTNITSLHLRGLPITDVELLSLLSMLPSLTHLGIEEMPVALRNRVITKRFLNSLALHPSDTPSSAPLLPFLREMNLVVHSRDIDPEAFKAALSSRWHGDLEHTKDAGNVSLQAVSISVMLRIKDLRTPDYDVLDCLRCFRDVGMWVSVSYFDRNLFLGKLPS
ncbi:hypothetical protein V5O48_002587 [Marasmius crinis-equi]|uniref:F-box domain-containing protein n=1 Tax=Marasmius crinis-equi TaxID=585013 RepID=A0ABR3FW04_9AGAR